MVKRNTFTDERRRAGDQNKSMIFRLRRTAAPLPVAGAAARQRRKNPQCFQNFGETPNKIFKI